MNDRLVLSHDSFNIAGGRRQDSADTLRVVPSLQTHTGEVAALFAVSEASTPGPMGARARRLVLDVIQGEYASRFDLAPGARLKSTIQAAQQELLNEFKGHVRIGVTILLAEGSALYLLQVPPAQAYVLHDASLHSVSAAQPHDGAPFAFSLGSANDPYVSLFKDTMEPSDIVVLCSSWFAVEMEPSELRAAFALDGPSEIAGKLFDQARRDGARDVSCIALQATTEQHSEELHDVAVAPGDAAGVWDRVDDAVGSLAYVWGRARDELKAPAAAGRATKPKSAPLSIDAPQAPPTFPEGQLHAPASAAPSPDYEEDQYAGEPILDDVVYPGPPSHESAFSEHGTDELPIVSEPSTRDLSGEWPAAATDLEPDGAAEEPDRGRDAELDDVNSFIQSTMNLGQVNPPVQGFPDMNVAPERIYPGSAGRTNRRQRRFGDTAAPGRGRTSAEKTPVLQPRLRGLDTARRRQTLSSIPPAMWLWSGVGVALLLVAFFAYQIFGGGAAAINYPLKAKARADKAVAAFRANNPGAAGLQLKYAWIDVGQARRHKFPPSKIHGAEAYILKKADIVHKVFHVAHATFVARFPRQNARLTQLAAGAPNVYALDMGRQKAYSVDPGKPKQRPTLVTRTGDAYTVTVGLGPVDWGIPAQLTAEGNKMIAMDQQYNVVIFEPGVIQPATLETLTAPSGSPSIVAMTTYATNLYLLDVAQGQVWRYEGNGVGGYVTSSTPWFVNAHRHVLRNAAGITIAHNAVYIVLRSGKLLKFVQGKRVPYTLNNLPVLFEHATQVYTRPNLSTIFLVNAASGKIVEVTDSGSYLRTIIVPKKLVVGMHQISVSSGGGTIYFLSHHTLYSTPAAP
jgi:hypothetical protein